jgi:hypothetical protein
MAKIVDLAASASRLPMMVPSFLSGPHLTDEQLVLYGVTAIAGILAFGPMLLLIGSALVEIASDAPLHPATRALSPNPRTQERP